MKFREINIATAEIEGLAKPPYYFEHHCYYAWGITFNKPSTLIFRNLPYIPLGNTEEEAEIRCKEIKAVFKNANIHNGDKVAILFDDIGEIIAIGRVAKDVWIDVRDNFTKKTFAQLNIVITSLKVN